MLFLYGKLDTNTEILIYISTHFMHKIQQNSLYSEKIKFEIQDSYNTVDTACKSRLDLFNFLSVSKYEKFLYLDTYILVKDDINKVFDINNNLNKVIHHFPGGPNVCDRKLNSMTIFLNKLKQI